MSHTFDRLHSALAGRYVLASELGSGGMASVYLAEVVLRPRETDIGSRAYWATNGKRIYFVRTERESDVFVAEVNR